MRWREKITDPSGSVTIHRAAGLVFDSGDDLPLLRAYKRIGYGDFSTLPSAELLDSNLLFRAGELSRCHVLDVTSEDPGNFRFMFYGSAAVIGGRFRHRRVADHDSPLLRAYGCAEFSRIKATAQPDLSQVEISGSASMPPYRRLVLPFGKGGEVTHLLSFFVAELQEVAPSPVDQVRAAVRQRVHD